MNISLLVVTFKDQKGPLSLCILIFYNILSLPFAHSVAAALVCSAPHTHTPQYPLGILHLLFPSPGMLFPTILTWLILLVVQVSVPISPPQKAPS